MNHSALPHRSPYRAPTPGNGHWHGDSTFTVWLLFPPKCVLQYRDSMVWRSSPL